MESRKETLGEIDELSTGRSLLLVFVCAVQFRESHVLMWLPMAVVSVALGVLFCFKQKGFSGQFRCVRTRAGMTCNR